MDYLASVQLSVQGLHPAFRPQRWVAYESVKPVVLAQLASTAELRRKNPDRLALLDEALRQKNLTDDAVGYLPLVREETTDWVALVRRSDAMPLAYLPMDGW